MSSTCYPGLPQTALAHLFTAAAINPIRLVTFLEDKKAAKRESRVFAALATLDLDL